MNVTTTNTRDFATIGTDEKLLNPQFEDGTANWTVEGFTYENGAVSHEAGSRGSLSQMVPIDPFSTYIYRMEVTTAQPGNVQMFISETPMLDSVTDYYLAAGGGQVVLGFFSFELHRQQEFIFSTDTEWAGTISSISFIKVAEETEAALINIPLDENGPNLPGTLKYGRYLAGNLAAGDRNTASCWEHPAAWNIALGARAQQYSLQGFENTGVGAMALQFNQASRNSAFGYSALRYNNLGEFNTALGFKANVYNTNGSYNTSIGFHASFLNDVGNQNTAVGYQALYTSLHDSYNTAMGSQAGLNCRGNGNTFVGALAGYLNQDANVTYPFERSTSLGAESKCYGNETMAAGWNARAGLAETPALHTTAVGPGAMADTDEATAVGDGARVYPDGYRATVVGHRADSTSSQGVSVGFLAHSGGICGTSVGAQAGTNQNGMYSTFLGYGAGFSDTPVTFGNVTCLGAATTVTGDNQVQLGSNTTTVYAYGAVQDRADARDVADVRDTELGLDFIQKLRPREFRWDMREDYTQRRPDGTLAQMPRDGSKKRTRYHEGLLAQEVKEALDALGVDWGGYQDHSIQGGSDAYSLGYTELIAPLIKAVQELKAEVDELRAALPQDK